MSASPDTGPDIDAEPDSDTDIESDVDIDISTANTMRERANENRIKLWLLLSRCVSVRKTSSTESAEVR